MRISADTYLSQVNIGNTVQRSFRRTQRLLTLLVIPAVFWCLKLTGITMAGEAFCGMEEHVHSEDCVLQELICQVEETPGHIHTEDCLYTVVDCGLPEQEGHTHSDACRNRTRDISIRVIAIPKHGYARFRRMQATAMGNPAMSIPSAADWRSRKRTATKIAV